MMMIAFTCAMLQWPAPPGPTPTPLCSTWTVRPLSPSQIAVATQAAAHLPELWDALLAALPTLAHAASGMRAAAAAAAAPAGQQA